MVLAEGCYAAQNEVRVVEAGECGSTYEETSMTARPDLGRGIFEVEACGHTTLYRCVRGYGYRGRPFFSCTRTPSDD